MTWGARITLFSAALFWGGLIALLSELAFGADPTVISSTVTGTTSSNTVGTTTMKGAASAHAPAISITNSDICKHSGGSMGVQAQLFGFSTGGEVITDEHCMRLKSARAMNAIGLKTVAASILAADPTTFRSMWFSGVTPPIEGKLGKEAREIWLANPELLPAPLTLRDLLTKDEYAAWEAARGPGAPVEDRMIDVNGEAKCKSEHGNYYTSC